MVERYRLDYADYYVDHAKSGRKGPSGEIVENEDDAGDWVKYKDYETLEKELEVYKRALSLAFDSDGCVYPDREYSTDEVDGEHQCYRCYVEKARELLDKSSEEKKV